MNFTFKHLLGIENLKINNINTLLNLAEKKINFSCKRVKKNNVLEGFTQINLFFEPSTRTQLSFELAGKLLGANVININISESSIKKGESFFDTVMTLNAMNPDLLVIRHNHAGVIELLSKKINCSIINAGDGRHEHPTQALLDALTIRRNKKEFKNLIIAICGDVLHSRVAYSNIILLNKMGAKIRLISPPTLLPVDIDKLNCKIFHNMKDGLKNVDIIMMLRLQTERMQGNFIPSMREYFYFYGLDKNKLAYANKNALVMHPGPINRGVEIDNDIIDSSKSLIIEQVKTGIAIRMAVIESLISHNYKENRIRV